MLETIDLSAKLDAETYSKCKAEARVELSRVQQQAREVGLPVVAVFEGWDFSGKSRCIQFLADPLDPRGMKVHAMYPPTAEEKHFPFTRRYFLRLPARGQIVLFLRSWYYHVLDERVHGGPDALLPEIAFEEIRQLEKMLADDGMLIVKFWLHIDQKEQRRRRKQFKRGDYPRWRVGPDDPKQLKFHEEYERAAEEMLASTSTDFARWYPIAANDLRYARIAIANRIINRVQDEIVLRERRKEMLEGQPPLENNRLPELDDMTSALNRVDLTLSLTEKDYDRRLRRAQDRLVDLQYQCVEQKRAVVICFEGWDAAGKGGVIRRMTRVLDPRFYNVHPVAAPRGEEADHHYLWRFWRWIPKAGNWAIFDRSWYGRVLVERIEGFATIPEWRRAFQEIRDFEAALTDSGAIVMKFWLHIDPETQLKRFQEREKIEYKRYKITDEDWRNREKWDQYHRAAEDMFRRTSTTTAPWVLVPSVDKRYARVHALERLVEFIEAGLSQHETRLRPNV
ncbi:thymidylate kinase [Planctomycetes bacterium Pan216]|uniref:Thymidylate kinase n=1 Tax=Kolteria novifilia TaxID=2527975 RepID=A0A518B992_9BACT|nr:thymidylate kinase [Planctomycetes bacterium Pan216]